MADIDGGFISDNIIESGIDFIFGNRVKCGCRFIQNYKRTVSVQRTGKCDLLGFSAGYLNSIFFEILIQTGFESLRHFTKTFREPGCVQTFFHPGFVIIHICRNILTETEGKQLEILEHNRENTHIFLIIIFSDINSVQQNFTFGWIVQAAEELDESGFPRAVHPDNCKPFPDPEFQADIPEGINIGSRIFETDIAKLDFVFLITTVTECPLFYRDCPLIHPVRGINDGEKCFHTLIVDEHSCKCGSETGQTADQT